MQVIMNHFFSWLHPIAPIDQDQPTFYRPTLSDEAYQRELFKLVTEKLTLFSEKQALIKAPISKSEEIILGETSLFFRQTKSWVPVETMLLRINSSDEKITKWVKNWLDRISHLRNNQQYIREKEKNLRKVHSAEDTLALRKAIEIAEEQTRKILREGRYELDNIEAVEARTAKLSYTAPQVLASNACRKVISFLSNNWTQLTVFYDIHEVSLSDEILVPVFYQRNGIFPFSQFPCTKAIFDLQAICQTEQSGNVLKGGILKTTHIRIKRIDLAPASPCASTIGSTDDRRSDSDTGHELKKIVARAIGELNRKLSKK